VTIGSFSAQLVVRLTLIAALLSTVGGWSYAATHWNSATRGSESSNTTAAAH
jgi:hypothetical protein